MAKFALIQQMETGEIILAPEGEKVVEARDFYAAFASSVDYSIEHDSDKIGLVPRDQLPPVGEHLLLAGRRWLVIDIDDRAKRAAVVPARGKRVPLFMGAAGSLDREVMQTMKTILKSAEVPAFLHSDAVVSLQHARTYYEQLPRAGPDVFETINGIGILPWEGTAINAALAAFAKADGIEAEISRDGLLITYGGCSRVRAEAHWRRVAAGSYTTEDLIPFVGDTTRERFDDFVPAAFLASAYISECLDVSGARKVAKALVR